MKRILRSVWAGAVGSLAAGAALSNDSSAELAAGGIQLTQNAAIEMRSEDLFISARQVRVHYVFLNTSPKDVTLTVAFPMPDITTNGVDDMISIPTQDPKNILGFSTTIDGKPVIARVEQKALKNGVDRTALLQSLHVPIAPHLPAAGAALDKLPKATQDRLVALGLAVPNDYDAGHGQEHHLGASWTLKTTYYWTETFPAGRPVIVEHEYQPSVGESAGTSWGFDAMAMEPDYAKKRAHYCVDDDFLASIRKTMKPPDEFPAFYEQRIEYILSSGANWKSPIADFHMTIDKGDPANLVSFCGTGVTKTGPTEFEVRYRNFRPSGDVSILILLPHKD